MRSRATARPSSDQANAKAAESDFTGDCHASTLNFVCLRFLGIMNICDWIVTMRGGDGDVRRSRCAVEAGR
jgi:hypothetical protein